MVEVISSQQPGASFLYSLIFLSHFCCAVLCWDQGREVRGTVRGGTLENFVVVQLFCCKRIFD